MPEKKKSKKELSKAKNLRGRIENVLAEFKESEAKKINLTDPDCSNMRSIQGKHASYNVQSVVDDKNSLIIHAEAVNDSSDQNQFARQVNRANKILNGPCKVACADAGYADTEELEKIDGQGIKVIVPSSRQASGEAEAPFNKRQFHYDRERDCYFCPEGHILRYVCTEKKTGRKRYQINSCASLVATGEPVPKVNRGEGYSGLKMKKFRSDWKDSTKSPPRKRSMSKERQKLNIPLDT